VLKNSFCVVPEVFFGNLVVELANQYLYGWPLLPIKGNATTAL